MTLADLYEHQIKSLSPADRLRLAALILNDITTTTSTSAVDESDSWGNDDYADFSRSTWNHIEQQERSSGQAR
jgi:hypothetical protein